MYPVGPSKEIARIRALPRRTWTDAEAAEVAALLTTQLKTPWGRMALKPDQGVALAEMHDAGGAFLGLSVGKGKTLIGFLAASIMRASRPVLLIPGNKELVEKTLREKAVLEYHWRLHPGLEIMTYNALSTAVKERKDKLTGEVTREQEKLDRLDPDLIIADEMHNLKNKTCARVRRFLKYLQKHPGCKFVGMSGTVSKKSIKDYWHLMGLALPDGSPLPYEQDEVEQWALALDPKVEPWLRMGAGQLLTLADPDPSEEQDKDELTVARMRYRRRLTQTRGVIISASNEIGTSLEIRRRPITVPDAVEESLHVLRSTWETPTGEQLTEAIQFWAAGRQLSQGFRYFYSPEPPLAWKEARRNWNAFVIERLGRHITGVDSPKQVALRYPDNRELAAWREIKPSYIPKLHQKVAWVDDYIAQDVARWLKDKDADGVVRPGIVWAEHVEAGKKIAEVCGIPYFGGGEHGGGKGLLDCNTSCVCSIQAHGTGHNLQRFTRMLFVSVLPGADAFEQSCGRIHRPGQEADLVTVDVLLPSLEACASFADMFDNARATQDRDSMPQKILNCDFCIDMDAIRADAAELARQKKSYAR